MEHILVTGGTGIFGRHLLPRLRAAHLHVRIMSRSPRPPDTPDEFDWATCDLSTGKGLARAVAGASTIIHAATGRGRNTRVVDIEGTERLLVAARAAGCQHFIYVSLAGADSVPHAYCRAKVEAESFVQASGLSWSIVRATQFHNRLYEKLLPRMRQPLIWLPTTWMFQPVHPGEAATYLVDHLAAGTRGRWRDFGGPEILPLGVMVEQWKSIRGHGPHVFRLPVLGRMAAALARGALTVPERAAGRISWSKWLRL